MPATDLQYDSQYRMSFCSDCGIKERANRLYRVDVRETSGYSISKRSSRTHYKYVKKRLCQECYEAYKRGQRIKFFLYLAAAAIVIVFAFSGKLQNLTPPDPSNSQRATTPPELPAQTEPTQLPKDARPTEQTPTLPEAPLAPQTRPQEEPNPAPVPTREVAPEQLVTVNDYANVRSAPNNGPIVRQVFRGDQLAVVQSQGSWAQVRKQGDVIGWIHRSLLSPTR